MKTFTFKAEVCESNDPFGENQTYKVTFTLTFMYGTITIPLSFPYAARRWPNFYHPSLTPLGKRKLRDHVVIWWVDRGHRQAFLDGSYRDFSISLTLTYPLARLPGEEEQMPTLVCTHWCFTSPRTFDLTIV
jgi:hypothetical protein